MNIIWFTYTTAHITEGLNKFHKNENNHKHIFSHSSSYAQRLTLVILKTSSKNIKYAMQKGILCKSRFLLYSA